MKSIPEKPEEVFDQFSNDIEKIFGKGVVSIVLFGSAATDEYIPKKSDINFLVVLTQEGIEQIQKVQRFVARWQKRRISVPLFLTRGYINASLDSFPIEFLNMQAAYRVIKGEDVLKGIKIKKRDLRLQCERELKGNLLKLRQGFIQTGGKARALKLLITGSIVAFTSIFRALLHLRGKDVPGTKQEILLATCREFGLNEGLFSVLLSLRGGGAKLTCSQLEENTRRYISEIQKLSEFVDKMKFS